MVKNDESNEDSTSNTSNTSNKIKSVKFLAACKPETIKQLDVIMKKYRATSRAHAFRLLIEDEYNRIIGKSNQIESDTPSFLNTI